MDCSFVTESQGAIRLLLHALGSGPNGSMAALQVIHNFLGRFPWWNLTEMLCRQEPVLEGPNRSLTLKPALIHLPILSQRNFFNFLNFATSQVPTSCVRLLANAIILMGDCSDAWLHSLSRQLFAETEMLTPSVNQRVMESLHVFCKELKQHTDGHTKLGWYKQSCITAQRKRKASCSEEMLLEGERGHSVKRTCTQELYVDLPRLSFPQEEQRVLTQDEEVVTEGLPEHLKFLIPRMKEILHGDLDTESWDDSFQADLKKICESCSPVQLQTVFTSLKISQISPQSIMRLCSHLLTLSPDLSYAQSSALAKSIFLEKVLFLTAPAPRPILAALSMFCTKYAQSVCSTLIGPLLLQAENGSVHTDFLCRMMSECFQLEHLPLCFRPVLDVPCSEGSICVLHVLLERQVIMSPSDFELLLLWMCPVAEKFSRSVILSKLLLNIMSQHQSQILSPHLELLTTAVTANQTFLKKSLQGALNRLRETVTL
ncbi:Fanconi anemia group E protein [Spea bombifrons]|uniref:Fanconi anemia group E protein n=1 Tax=Spea bombifrons TaxID=233779 RepID=UPI0023498489|nr:Fanconi anemia group E protein [Spea bombifrons]